MASQYYINRNGTETGPYGFRDLVSLVRVGELIDSDLVRYSWTNEWQRAESLVGLFHMAKRPALPSTLEETASLSEKPDVVPDEPFDAVLPEVDDRPRWMLRLLQVGGLRRRKPGDTLVLGPIAAASSKTASASAPLGNAPPSDGLPPQNTHPGGIPARPPPLAPELADFAQRELSASRDDWSSAVEDALISVKSRGRSSRNVRRTSRVFAFFQRFNRSIPRGEQGRALSGFTFRLVCAIVCANLVAWAVNFWSAQEALRFPSRDLATSILHQFPLYGTCGTSEYLFLIFDLMLFSGAAGWFAAGWIESHAD